VPVVRCTHLLRPLEKWSASLPKAGCAASTLDALSRNSAADPTHTNVRAMMGLVDLVVALGPKRVAQTLGHPEVLQRVEAYADNFPCPQHHTPTHHHHTPTHLPTHLLYRRTRSFAGLSWSFVDDWRTPPPVLENTSGQSRSLVPRKPVSWWGSSSRSGPELSTVWPSPG
jgi:hypothetical protein